MPRVERIPELDVIFERMKQEGYDTQKQLAAAAGLNKDTLTSLLNETRSGSVPTYKKLGTALKVNNYKELYKEVRRIDPPHTEQAQRQDEAAQEYVPASMVRDIVELAHQMLTAGELSRQMVDRYLLHVGELCRLLIHPDIAWVDVMERIEQPDACNSAKLVTSASAGTLGWLQVVFSEVPRTATPRVIPIDIEGKPWRGSGAAFASQGIDYVDRMVTRLLPSEYNLDQNEGKRITEQYRAWECQDHFASLIALSIPSPGNSSITSGAGVLNLNLSTPHPFGEVSVLPPEDTREIVATLKPHLDILAKVMQPSSRC